MKQNTKSSEEKVSPFKNAPEIPTIDISVVEKIIKSVVVDSSKIKIDCNQKALTDNESADKLLDKKKDTKWCATFKPKDTNIKMNFSEPVELISYTFVLGNDCPERDPIEWRVRIKEASTMSIFEEAHRISDYSETKCGRLSSQDFKLRSQKRVSEITFVFDKLQGVDAKQIQLCQIQIKAVGGSKKSPTFVSKVTSTISKSKLERSKSDSGSEGTKRERADHFSSTFQENIISDDWRVSQTKLDAGQRSELYKDYGRLSSIAGSNQSRDSVTFKNLYFNPPKYVESRSSIAHVNPSNSSVLDEIRRTSVMLEGVNRRNSVLDTKFLSLGKQQYTPGSGDYKIDLYKDFKYDSNKQYSRVSENADENNENMIIKATEMTVHQVIDSPININIESKMQFDQMKSQNDIMYEKLKYTKPYEAIITKTVTQDNSYSYQKYLEEQEKRHSAQIEKIYQQNSDYNSRLQLQIASLQSEKSEIERNYMVEIKEYQNRCSHLEMKYSIDMKKYEEQTNSHSIKYESYSLEIQRLQNYIQEQEKISLLRKEELHSCKHSSAEVETKFHSEFHSMQTLIHEHEQQVIYKTQECKALQLKINEIEKSSSFQIESLYQEKSEQERRFYLKVEECNKYQVQLRDIDVSYQLKIEKIQTQLTQERTFEIEKKYNYQIEQLYQQMAEMEKKHQTEIKLHMESYHEVEKKYSYQIEMSQKQDADYSNRLTLEIANLKEVNYSLEQKMYSLHHQFEQERSELEIKYKSEINIYQQRSIEIETRYQHEFETIKRTTNTQQYTVEISRMESQIQEMEKMHKSQVETLYMQLSEREKQYKLQVDQYKSQLIYLEKRHSEELIEVKRIYHEDQVSKKVDLKTAISIELKAKYEAELFSMQQMNQDLVRKHVSQIETLYSQNSEVQLKHAADVKSYKDQVSYLEGKYAMLKHFEEKMAHYEIPETKIIYKYDEGLVTQNAYYEKRHSELMSQIMILKEENKSLSSQVTTLNIRITSESENINKKMTMEIQMLKHELSEQERKYSIQIESLYQEKQIQEKFKLEKIEHINSLMIQIQSLEKKHQEYIFTIQSEWSKKESSYHLRIEEYRVSVESSSSIEYKFTQQIERMNHDFSISEKMYAQQIKTLQDQHDEMETSFAKKIEIQYTKYSDLEKMYSFEMRKMTSQQKEASAKMESQIQKLIEEKIYLETQKTNFSVEIKKLFAINAELEKKLANKELEFKAMYETKEGFFKRDTTKLQEMSSILVKTEQTRVEKIEEMIAIQTKYNDLEKSYASQIESLYIKIADQEARYKMKVEEINSLQQQNNNLLIQSAQSSQGIFMQHSIQEEKVSQSMIEISQFKEINAELERKFLLKIQELQSQNFVFENRESEFKTQLTSMQEVNREQIRRYQALEEEFLELNSIREKWNIFKTSEESKYESKVTQLESYHSKQVQSLKTQYESKMFELKSIKENGTEKETQLSIQIKNLQTQNASFEKRQAEYMEQIRNMQNKYGELQKTHNQATQKYYIQLSEQEKLHSSKVSDYTSIIEQVRQLQLSKNQLEMKHANQIEELVSQNALLESKQSESHDEVSKLQSKIIEVQSQYAEFKENTFNESHILDSTSNSKLEELRKLESRYMEFDIKQSAQVQMVESQKIEIEQKLSVKDLEIKQVRDSIEVVRREHYAEMEELRKQNAEYVSNYNKLKLEKFSEFSKTHLVDDASIESKYQIEILKKQIEEMRNLSKYQFSHKNNEIYVQQESKIQFLENKCKSYLEEIAIIKNNQSMNVSYSQNQDLQNNYLKEDLANLMEKYSQLVQMKTNAPNISMNFNQEQEQRIRFLSEENLNLREHLLSYQTKETALNIELESYKMKVRSMQTSLETLNTRHISQVIGESEEVRSLKDKNSVLEKKQATLEKLHAKNNEIKIRYKKKEEEKSIDEGVSSFGGTVFSDKVGENNMFYHESFQARKGYDTSSMVKFATSIPNIPDLIKKNESDLKKLGLSKIEWSTVNNKFQPPALQSIKFFFSDGTTSAEWGQRDSGSLQTFEFDQQVKVASVGFDYGNFYILQISFYDDSNKVIVKCGNVGDDSKVKSITHDAKIIYAYGASSIDNKCVGMIGFTFYKPQSIIEKIEVQVTQSKDDFKVTRQTSKEPIKTNKATEIKVRRISVVNKK